MDEARFKAWHAQDDTKEFFKYLQGKRDECTEGWVAGRFTSDTVEGTAMMNAEALGVVSVIDDILNLVAEDVS